MTFSYAQAARGITTPTNVSSNPGSSASSEKGFKEQVRETIPALEASNVTNANPVSKPSTKVEKEDAGQSGAPKTVDLVSEERRIEPGEGRQSNGISPSNEVDTNVTQAPAESTAQKQELPHEILPVERSKDTKEADDEWEKVSIPSTVPDSQKDKELKPAPIPSVNFWTQRSQQLQAKPKDTAVTPKTHSTSVSQKPRQLQGNDEKKKPGNDVQRASSGARSSRDQHSASASPGSLSQHEVTAAPPTIDAQFWPTPENSTVDIGRRNSIRESTAQSEVVDSKPAGKQKWTAVPFVPTVKFETQLPGQARRGGKAASRGRGGFTSSGDRTSEKIEPGSMGPPPLPKTSSEQDRGRKASVAKTNRASSVSNTDDGTYASNIALPQATEKSGEIATDTRSPSTQEESRSSSRQPMASQRTDFNSDPFQSQTSTSPSRQYSGSKEGPRSSQDFGDRSQAKNQKSETWRRTDRSERGRGGMRGGRGGTHSSFNSPYTSPPPQNGFESSKGTGERSRQQSAQGFGTPYNTARGGPRSQSIPIHMLANGSFYQPGFSEGLPPIQTNMPYSVYQPQSAMSAGSMSAIPFNPLLADFALVSMVVTQLEYYFSVDNLCKDMFLRKNMDSQGFVPLQVIADFRRIKTLLGDPVQLDALRGMASHVRNLEILTAEDGKDHVRSRENWKDFVLPMEERVEHSQHDGPVFKPNQQQTPAYETNGLRSAPPNTNGFHDAFRGPPQMIPFQTGMIDTQATEQWAARVENARLEEERRTSMTSPLSKIQSPIHESRNFDATNGHRDSMSSSTTARESTFPDENVAALKVVVKDPDYQGQDETTAVEEPVPTRVSGLRGGAGSPEQFERIRSLQFGHNAPLQNKRNQALYTIQAEGPPPHLVRPGYIWEEYYSLRDLAKAQRAENHFDGAVVPLYPLWAEFLCVPNQFNVGMYEDFKTWAVEDEEKDSGNGKRYLVKFFDSMLNGNSPVSERVAADIVDIARHESGNRPTWLKLKAAWRNGATNLKTRKRISDLLSTEEKASLDRGV